MIGFERGASTRPQRIQRSTAGAGNGPGNSLGGNNHNNYSNNNALDSFDNSEGDFDNRQQARQRQRGESATFDRGFTDAGSNAFDNAHANAAGVRNNRKLPTAIDLDEFHDPAARNISSRGGNRDSHSLLANSREHVPLMAAHASTYSSGVVTIDPTGLTSRTQGIKWTNWVVISGFSQHVTKPALLQRFQAYGEITEFRPADGNWMAVEYSSAIAADRAVATENGQLWNADTLLSVMPLTPQLAEQLRIFDGGPQRQQIENYGGFGAISSYNNSNNNNIGNNRLQQRRTGQHSHVNDKPQQNVFELSAPLGRSSAYGQVYRSAMAPSINQYMQPPKKHSSCCNKVMEFFFSF